MLDAVELEVVKPSAGSSTRYTGAPTPEVEEAWDNLWECKSFHVEIVR